MEAELPDGWTKAPLLQSVNLVMGQSPKSSDVNTNGNGLPFLQGNAEFGDYQPNPKKWVKAPLKIAPANSTLMSVRAPVGAVNYTKNEVSIGRGLCALLGKEDNHSFIFYLAQFIAPHLRASAQGSTFEAVNKKDFASLELALPPLPEQQRIAEILTAVDDSIRAGERVIEQTERVKKGLMEELLTGGLGSAAIERGEVPEGWRQRKLGDAVTFANGYAFKSKDFCEPSENTVAVVRMSDFNDGYVELATSKRVPKSICEQLERFALRDDDILIAMSGATVGKLGLVKKGTQTAYLNQRVGCIRAQSNALQAYIWSLMQLPSLRRTIIQTATGNAQPNISGGQILNLTWALPETKEQRRIASILTSIDDQIETERKHVEQQKRLKRGLMDDLLTGRVRTV